MKLWILSDLHLDGAAFQLMPPPVEADVVIVAGDVTTPLSEAVRWLRSAFRIPVVAVAGNHEFYGVDLARERWLGAQLAQEAGIHLLEEDVKVIAGVRFLGCTLWTDYKLDGDPQRAMRDAAVGLMDHQLIRYEDGRFLPLQASAMHRRSRHWLDAVLGEPFAGPSVVVTHHAPHARSISPNYVGDPLNPAFASDLSALIRRQRPALWVHGHVHASHDYRLGTTRVICNPRGYGRWGVGAPENPGFDPHLVVDVV